MSKRKYSEIWTFYTPKEGENAANCNDCGKLLKTTGGSTRGLHVHLKTIHGIEIQKPEEQNVSKIKKQKATVEAKVSGNEKTLKAIVSRLIAKDGLSFRTIANSSNIIQI